MTSSFKVCSHCFFSNQFPGVHIENNGKCNICNQNHFSEDKTSITHSNIDELIRIASDIRDNSNSNYDCLIGASGGLDSSYVIYIVKKILKLNPLILNYDQGFTDDIAKSNLKNISLKLDVDLITIKSKFEYDIKYIKNYLNAFEGSNIFWGICYGCHYVLPAVAYKIALKHKISTIFSSYNYYEGALHWPKSQITGSVKLNIKFNILISILSNLLRDKQIKRVYHLALALYYLFKLKSEFHSSPMKYNWVITKTPQFKKNISIRRINITNYIPWNINEMIKVLRNELDWKCHYHEIPMRFDCLLDKAYMSPSYKNFSGTSLHGIIANNLIYDGLMTKNELEKAIESYDQDPIIEKELINNKILFPNKR